MSYNRSLLFWFQTPQCDVKLQLQVPVPGTRFVQLWRFVEWVP